MHVMYARDYSQCIIRTGQSHPRIFISPNKTSQTNQHTILISIHS